MNDHLNSVTSTPYVTMPGPGGSAIVMTPEAKEEVERHANILRITPEGYDPLIYWHSVSQDAIKTSEKAKNDAKQAREERDRIQRAYDGLVERLTAKIANERKRNPLDLTNLITMAGTGQCNLNIAITISKGEGKEYHPYDYERSEDE